MKQGYIYIMSNSRKTTFYVGVTANLEFRVLQHKAGCGSKFTARYNLFDLLYWEKIEGMSMAIAREKQLKNWHREWKYNLIQEQNPEFKDLAKNWFTLEEIKDFKKNALADSETSSE